MTRAQLAVLRTLAEGGSLWHSAGTRSRWSGLTAYLVPARGRGDARRVRMATVEPLVQAGLLAIDPDNDPDVVYHLTPAGRRAAR